MKKIFSIILITICMTAFNDLQNTSTASPDDIREQVKYQRAMEAVNWGMPVVNFDLMLQEFKKNGGDYNKILYWSKLFDWKNQTLTPNPDVIYIMPFFDTKDWPMVLEIPPANGGVINGSIMDIWQAAIDDVGPAGLDKGKGGKYLILPPDYKGSIPSDYLPMHSYTYHGYALLRSIPKTGSDADVKAAVDYAKKIKFYPYSQAANPPQTAFIDAMGKEFNSLIQYDHRYFESLNRVIQSEIWLERDRAMIDILKYIGIEKGRAFNPDAQTVKLFDKAAADAHEWLETQYVSHFHTPFYEGTQWAFPVTDEFGESVKNNFTTPNSYPVDMRGVALTFEFFSAKHLGEGQFYLLNIKDKNGEPYKGSNSYRLTVPANVPAKNYWSITLYDRETHCLIRNMSTVSRSSLSPGLKKNADGSATLYFGPKAPADNEKNWVPTDPDREFELLFRIYGPDPSFFKKTWTLPDAEKM
ncbi:DUF1254 domain-containing protein [Polluticoccus soli]|uniref:DUF1254 domain-containing protein n=1 Tax=Polluticoccus soli TaxID=3034150 RepID=UPI0023E25AF2|nr:DUF1254 domain-containing protein [Flavipsychrobacter sp. JY13-12]